MLVVRLYTGADGKSHFEEVDIPWEKVSDLFQRTVGQDTTSVHFRRQLPGASTGYHITPQRQYIITLEGQIEIGVGDGIKRLFKTGEVMLAEDLTGQGHTVKVVGDKPRVSVWIPLA